jgi:RNA polymerase sigma-70 factor (ECF subfamily)
MLRRVVDKSDVALLSLIAAGEELALAELYDRFGRVAYGLALRILRDPGLAEEAVQDAFLSAWRSAGRFDATRWLPRSWLLTIVHRRAVDLVQHAVRRPEVPAEELPGGSSSPPTEETAALREERRAVLQALELISGEQREALELAYYGGYSQTQISDGLGVPLGTIKTRMFHGVRRLGVLLSDSSLDAPSPQSACHQRFAADAAHMQRGRTWLAGMFNRRTERQNGLTTPLQPPRKETNTAATRTAERVRMSASSTESRRASDETKLSLKTTEFWAMAGLIVAILIASAVSDSLGDVRAWTLVAAVGIGYMISRGGRHQVRGRRRPAQPREPLTTNSRRAGAARSAPAHL